MIRVSIRWRLTLWYGLALCVILGLFSAATYWRYRAAARRAFDADLSTNLDTLQSAFVEEMREAESGADESGRPALEARRKAARETLDEFRLNGLYAEIREGGDGETPLARLPRPAIGREGGGLPERVWRDAAASGTTRWVTIAPSVRAAIRSFRPRAEEVPIELAVADRTGAVDEVLSAIRRALFLFGSAGLLLAVIGGYVLATRALSSIDTMTRQAAGMSVGSASPGSQRLQVPDSDDELGRLARTFNQLLDRIASSVGQLKDFIADAAHELKTPVSVIRAEAELSLSAERRVEEYRDALGTIASESQWLSQIVGDLTLLAEGQTLDHPLERRLVDVKELCQEVARSLRAAATSRRITLAIESSGRVEYRGDERLLRQVVTNLFENAVKYSRSPGRVGAAVAGNDGTIELRVADEAPTLSLGDRERVFGRFYRGRESAGGESGGSGLGLAIARWAVELHGGQIRVEPSTTGNVFVVSLPATAPSSPAPRPL